MGDPIVREYGTGSEHFASTSKVFVQFDCASCDFHSGAEGVRTGAAHAARASGHGRLETGSESQGSSGALRREQDLGAPRFRRARLQRQLLAKPARPVLPYPP